MPEGTGKAGPPDAEQSGREPFGDDNQLSQKKKQATGLL